MITQLFIDWGECELKKVKLKKIVTILTIISMIITLISAIFNFVIPVYLSYKLNINAGEVHSIGIIGGADGPTSIYVTSSYTDTYLITVIFTVISVAGIVYQIYTKKTTK